MRDGAHRGFNWEEGEEMAGVRRNLEIRLAVVLVFGIALLAAMGGLVLSAPASASPPKYELVKRFGPDGSDAASFTVPPRVAIDQKSQFVYALAGNEFEPGALNKFDDEGNPVDWGGAAPYIASNEISGLEVPQSVRAQVAVNSETHVLYVTSANTIRAFQSDGEPAEFTAGPNAGSDAITGFGALSGIAVDVDGNIYASDASADLVKVFASSGEQLTQFAADEPLNLAVDTTGSVYAVTRFLGDVHHPVIKFEPSTPLPVTPATTYSAAPSPVDSEGSSSVAVDPPTNDVYVVHVGNGIDAPGVFVYSEDGTPITSFAGSGSEGELGIAGGIAVDGATEKVYVGNEASETAPRQVYVFQKQGPAKPKIEVTAVGGISTTSATLYARINPEQRPTTYWFEYGPNDCSTSVCTTVPVGGAAISEGNDGVWVSQKIQGLSANTEYHFLVVAENDHGSDEASGVFRTQENDLAFGLSDSRAWEMISPPNKRGALLHGTEETSAVIQAAADGNGIAYTSNAPVEAEPEGSRAVEPVSILARWEAPGWQSEEITPPNAKITPIAVGKQGEYKLFSPDLSKAILDPRSGTPLSDEASERAPYLRENTTPPVYRPLVTGKAGFANVPPGTEFGGGEEQFVSSVLIRGANPDLSHVILESRASLIAGAPEFSLYEWSGGQLSPISVLPSGEGGAIVSAPSASGLVSMRHAISDDGSRVFWTAHHLYMRDMEAGDTIRLDEVQGGTGEGKEEPVFQGASADGTIAFFTDTQQLTLGSGSSFSKADLYECEIVQSGSTSECELRDLTPEVGSEAADVQGVVSAISDDGSRAYFVAKGALTTEANQAGQEAVGGQPNLYLWQAGEGLRFIATLATEDRPDWGRPNNVPAPGEDSRLSTSSSPSGRYFVFMSERDITDQENVDVGSGEPVERIFRFDADAGRLECLSCPPGGAAPQGNVIGRQNELVDPRSEWFGRRVAATVPQPEVIATSGTTIYQPRVVLDNGRVFFNAIDSLVPADSNRQWDIYQYEDLGVGDCEPASGNAAIKRSGGGCVSLISSGTGEAEAGFLDASVSGNDVFFLTPARLSVTDVDNELDLYDARVGGTPATLALGVECGSGEACHPALSQVQEVAPDSASFNGAGNVKPLRRCPRGKHKVKRRGGKQRCVPRKGKKHHRRAGHRKGANQ
ncbi:MAG TPA: hypothetical protein VFL77_07965 [Solirubrobacterales bacterium]|nr:hypothetical protein [Solirubrobacterales bacterium]